MPIKQTGYHLCVKRLGKLKIDGVTLVVKNTSGNNIKKPTTNPSKGAKRPVGKKKKLMLMGW